MDRLFEEVQFIKGVGPKRSQLLQKMDVDSVFDLLWHVPRAYFNRSKVDSIAALQAGNSANIQGRVINVNHNRSRRGFSIFKAMLDDGTGIITAVWFNQAYLANQIKPGQELFLRGKVKISYGVCELSVGEYEVIDPKDLDLKVVPLYPLTDGLNQKVMRSILLYVLDNYLEHYPEIMDTRIRDKYNLCNIQFAFKNIHFPESGGSFLQARKRLAFEELLLFRLKLNGEKSSLNRAQGIIHKEKNDLVAQIKNSLPFALTAAQKLVLGEIFADMESFHNMNRLLQGDVGSGKTVVAALTMAKAVASGYQAAIMAPTEILADQHYAYLKRLFEPTGVIVARLTGGTSAAERSMILQAVSSGEIDILVGTHALIQEEVHFHNLGLAVIDEQHRFGVRQRALLSQKASLPDVLVMTATPIPRTLALTVYGDLDLSIIDELPPGRKVIKTMYVKRALAYRAYDFMRQEVEKGVQAYVVCPLVEESEKQDLQAAVTLHEQLRESYPDLTVGLIHGRMKSSEKDYVMERFKSGQIQVLVSTTVIEVGVDVSNASIMVIEHAERFGLSQLHQLRGRVGRGELQSYCLLIGEPKTDEALMRLRAMEKSTNGFDLANEDLTIRGPGDFWGVRQHGLNELKVANLLKDQKIIEQTAEAAALMEPLISRDTNILKYIEKKFKKSAEIARN